MVNKCCCGRAISQEERERIRCGSPALLRERVTAKDSPADRKRSVVRWRGCSGAKRREKIIHIYCGGVCARVRVYNIILGCTRAGGGSVMVNNSS